jgi:[acyl-carrier-protein] S-malonyltransferase
MASAPPLPAAQIDEPGTDSAIESGTPAPLPSRSSNWLYPGLGCRYVGMGYDIIGRFSAADRLIAAAADRLGYDLVAVCLAGSGRKHVPPRQEAQVIYVLECAYTEVLKELGFQPRAVSGHSLGTLAAAVACDALDFVTGLELVNAIEALQEDFIDGRGQAMGVIIGLPLADVESLLASHPRACLANWNSPGQYVVAGDGAAVDKVLAGALSQGAKQSRRLPGERALHSPHMQEVAARLRDQLTSVAVARPRVPFISCCSARRLETADEMRAFLGEFLAAPVRWSTVVETLRNEWGGDFVEVGPGNVLSNMLPFIDRAAAIQTASDLLEQKASR